MVSMQTFPEYLLESPYITSNPEEADYFYVHVRMTEGGYK
jgi:hypothetical protein